MGELVERIDEGSEVEFRKRLRRNLAAAKNLVERDGFGHGQTTIGAELELSLIDREGQPALENRRLLEAIGDKRFTVELDRFNLEYNADPGLLAGKPFSALGEQLVSAQETINQVDPGISCVSIGTLPSLDLGLLSGDEAMTDLPRYRALELALRSFRRKPFELDIDGEDPLNAHCDGVTLEGANTSLQIHLHVTPEQFADSYNAAQLATPIALALAGNSPLFCGHRLWEETRIVVFKQAVDIRGDRRRLSRPPRVCYGHGWTRKGVYELLAEAVHLHEPLLPHVSADEPDSLDVALAGGVPALRELRLHLGTIWRWNRPVVDTSGDGHLRIELRSLAGGPTVIDMMATSAFYLGLTLGLRERIGDLISAIPFEYVRTNFYRAAQYGLSAELAWPTVSAPSPERGSAKDLALRLLPVARQGLIENGVDEAEVTELLEVIEARVQNGQTGAQWQRAAAAKMAGAGKPDSAALADLTLAYLERSASNQPAHTWSLP